MKPSHLEGLIYPHSHCKRETVIGDDEPVDLGGITFSHIVGNGYWFSMAMMS